MNAPSLQSPDSDSFREVPHSVESEKAVLSCMMQSRDVLADAVAGKVIVDYFYNEGRQVLFEALSERYEKGQPTSGEAMIGLTDDLRDRKQLDLIGGPGGLAEILRFVSSPAEFGYYTDRIRAKYVLRQIIKTSDSAIAGAYELPIVKDKPISPEDYLNSCESEFLKIRDRMEKGDNEGANIGDVCLEVIDEIQEGTPPGIKTRFTDLDHLIGGLAPGQLIILAARPGMGKTALMLNICANIGMSWAGSIPDQVDIYSLEMTKAQLTKRMISSVGEIELERVLGKSPIDKHMGKLGATVGRIHKSKIWIDDTPALDIRQIQARARRRHRRNATKLIAIDYLQLLKAAAAGRESRQVEVSAISSGLKALAKELGIPIIALAQLKRESDNHKRPRLSDLRESGSIEQDADVVGLLHRDAYYAEDEDERAESEGKSTLIVAKQRDGATGDVPLVFNDTIVRFQNAARNHQQN